MTFKTILVHCDGDKSVSRRLDVATEIAMKFGSHLVGIHIRAPFEPPAFFDGSLAMDELYKMYEDARDADQANAFTAFANATEGRSIAVERRVVDGPVTGELIRRARYADLLVVGQTSRETPTATPSDLPEIAVLSGGRPVVVVPGVDAKRPIGRTVMLCWNGSREAARAAADALPFLKAAEKVIVLAVREEDSGEDAGPTDVAIWLSRHGVKAAVLDETTADVDAADHIFSRTADLDVDLVVMGLYGHTRTRELVLGGVSRSLLRRSRVPIFASH